MENVQTDNLSDEQTQKKGRHRKKQLYSSILSQMEFYFSDSNLTKDRFLSQLIKENPFVSLETFLKFNKIRKLTTNIEDIQKAVRKSNLIQLSDDKNSICRKEPVKEKLNVDECTIYVEGIKSDTAHDWLSQVFSEFGNVVYVSIPKYSYNKLNKGFAFIEFNTESEAESALNYFESIEQKIPAQTDPEQLYSISTFEGNNDNSSKRKLDETDEENESKRKKIKLNENDEDTEKKKKKQKKKKNFFKELGLRILSKKDWKKMRNRYLDLQKKKMKEFKQHLYKAKFSQQNSKFKKPDDVKEETAGLAFSSGLIVKVKLNEPCQDSKKLKTEIKCASPHVKFIDIPLPASEEIYVRFVNDSEAKDFCTQETFGEKFVLEGEEERLYWKKIASDRKTKLNRESKKQRGRDKLLKKANNESVKHIKFDE